MSGPAFRNSGAFNKAVGCGAVSATAAGAGDNTEITGATINRADHGYPQSAKVVVSYKTTLSASETLKFGLKYQTSSDGSSWDTAVVVQAATTDKTGAATNFVGEVEYDVDLSGLKQYVRFNLTPDLSASGTDTMVVSYVAMLGGARSLPQSASNV